MPSKSRAQQRFMGMVHAVQQGKMKAPSAEVAKAAKSIPQTAVKEFASTKSNNLPLRIIDTLKNRLRKKKII
jgi:hypothetical protein